MTVAWLRERAQGQYGWLTATPVRYEPTTEISRRRRMSRLSGTVGPGSGQAAVAPAMTTRRRSPAACRIWGTTSIREVAWIWTSAPDVGSRPAAATPAKRRGTGVAAWMAAATSCDVAFTTWLAPYSFETRSRASTTSTPISGCAPPKPAPPTADPPTAPY